MNLHQAQSYRPSNSWCDRIFDVNPIKMATPGLEPQPFNKDQMQYNVPLNSTIKPPTQAMSSPYLQMKQDQERRSLMESSEFNPMVFEALKKQQAQELQQNLALQTQTKNQNGWSVPMGLDSRITPQYSTLDRSQLNSVGAYNAQGREVSSQLDPSMHQNGPNKYKDLKNMSPDMLNQLYGRQASQSVLPQCQEESLGDIYEATSYNANKYQWSEPSPSQLKTQLELRKQEILNHKSKLGIQSYTENQRESNLDDAYPTNLPNYGLTDWNNTLSK